jgi:site-specific DNA-methyltransferase (cytosine-N4-specific)
MMPTEQAAFDLHQEPRNQDAALVELYRTDLGRALVGTAEQSLAALPADSVDLVMTSPPFPLLRAKEYGNRDESTYTDWLVSLGPAIRRVLRDTGSFVLDLGGAYRKKRPARSLYNYRVLLRLCDECGFHLAEEFFWHNPSKLPSPIEWVNKRKIRAKDSVDTVWWLSKTEWPRADVRNVLTAYSPRMRQLLADPDRFCRPHRRPSGHAISPRFADDNGGAIPSNLLTFSNTDSNSLYLRLCKRFGLRAHPARFPEALPDFFIRFLTNPDDTVVDLFAGSNATGAVAQRLGRRWLSVDSSRPYVLASAFRFMNGWSDEAIEEYLEATRLNEIPLSLSQGAARLLLGFSGCEVAPS